MKFVLKFEEGYTAPCAWCEVCSCEITDAEMAMVYWCTQDYVKKLHAPLLVHKLCMSASRARDEDYDLSMELTTYLAFLLQNVGLAGPKLTEAIRNADLISTL
jgi:hypothetical protein